MIRRCLLAALGLGVLSIACNATPDIPNDLRTNNGTYPGRGAKDTTPDDSEAAPEGEQELTGGRTPGPSAQPDGGSGTTPDPDPLPDAGTTPTTPPPNTACAGSATSKACFTCCEQQAPGAVQKLNQLWDDCACAANKCGQVCSQSWCAGFFPNQGDQCDQCLDAIAAQCNTQSDTACKADATCGKMLACDEGSGCAAKP